MALHGLYMRLYYGNRPLDDSKTMRYYGVTPNSAISLIVPVLNRNKVESTVGSKTIILISVLCPPRYVTTYNIQNYLHSNENE